MNAFKATTQEAPAVSKVIPKVRFSGATTALVVVVLLFAGCGKKVEEAEYAVEVNVKVKGGGGIPGALLKLNEAEIGRTDANGRFAGAVRGAPGQEVVLTVTPPRNYEFEPGFTPPKAMLEVEETDQGFVGKPLVFSVVLNYSRLDFALLVTAPGQYRPIYADEQLIGRTNSKGAAVVHLTGKPGSKISIRVDKRSKGEKSLGKTFTLAVTDRVLNISESDILETTAGSKPEVRGTVRPSSNRVAARQPIRHGQGRASQGRHRKSGSSSAVDAEDLPTSTRPSKRDKLAAKRAASAAAKHANAAAASARAVKRSAALVAKMLPPGEQLLLEAQNVSERAMEPAAQASEAARAARDASKGGDRSTAEAMAERAAAAARQASDEKKNIGRLVEAARDRKQTLAKAAEAERRSAIEAQKAAAAAAAQHRNQLIATAKDAVNAALEYSKEADDAAKKAAKEAGKVRGQAAKEAKAAAREAGKAARQSRKAALRARTVAKKLRRAPAEKLDELAAEIEGLRAEAQQALELTTASRKRIASLGGTGMESAVSAGPNKRTGTGAGGAGAGVRADAVDDAVHAQPVVGGCSVDELTRAVNQGNVSREMVSACNAIPSGDADYPQVHFQLARYFHKKKRYRDEQAALDKATSFGRYKYDPEVLFALVKVAIHNRNYSKALKIKDRFLQVKDRLPPSSRSKKVAEMYELFAKSYEFQFYKEHEKNPDGEHIPLLEKAIDMWERYVTYSGDESKGRKEIEKLRRLREEVAL